MEEAIIWAEGRPTDVGWYWFEGTGPLPDVPPGRYRVRVEPAYGFLIGYLHGTQGGWVLDAFTGRWSGPIAQPADYTPPVHRWRQKTD